MQLFSAIKLSKFFLIREFYSINLPFKITRMKISKSIFVSFILLVVIASLYRIMPGRPWGFAPQIAMAIFGGAIIRDKKMAFLLPLLSMFISDALFEYLYRFHGGLTAGFYQGQLTNYILFTLMTFFGFFARNLKPVRIGLAALAAPTTFFLLSNFFVWASRTGGYQRPMSFEGLLMCYNDGLPFYYGSLGATVFFSVVLFGGYFLFVRSAQREVVINNS